MDGALRPLGEVAKYYVYSSITEEHYAKIYSSGTVIMQISHTAYIGEMDDVFLAKDSTFVITQ